MVFKIGCHQYEKQPLSSESDCKSIGILDGGFVVERHAFKSSKEFYQNWSNALIICIVKKINDYIFLKWWNDGGSMVDVPTIIPLSTKGNGRKNKDKILAMSRVLPLCEVSDIRLNC